MAVRKSAQDDFRRVARDLAGLRPPRDPKRITAGLSWAEFAGPTPRSPSTRCGLRTSAWPLAAAASAAIMPATPSALDRACPCPQPSATTSTTPPPLHFSQSSLLQALPVGAGRAALAPSRDRAASERRSRNGAPSLLPSRLREAAGHRERALRAAPPRRTRRSHRRRGRTAGRACRSRRVASPQPLVPAEGERRRLHVPRAPAMLERPGRRRTSDRGSAPNSSASAGRAGCRATACPGAAHAACSAASQRAPTSRSDRKAAAMIGLMTDAGIAS